MKRKIFRFEGFRRVLQLSKQGVGVYPLAHPITWRYFRTPSFLIQINTSLSFTIFKRTKDVTNVSNASSSTP